MMARGGSAGSSTRAGIEPPATGTTVSRTAAPWLRTAAARRSWRACSTGTPGILRSSPDCAISVAVASSSAMDSLQRGRADREPRVAVRRDLLTPPPVLAEAADVGQEQPGLARDVRAHVPAVGGRGQRRRGDLLDVRGPLAGRLRRRLDRLVTVLTEVAQQVGDPLDVLLNRNRHVGDHAGTAGPGDGEQIR